MTQWREERDRAVAARAAALTRLQEAESELAAELIAGFVKTAREKGLPSVPLTSYSYPGNVRYRTGLSGWYLNYAKTVAIDVDGNYYSLGVPASIKARFAGARPQPQRPKLIVGEGARDGESMPLKDLLNQLLVRANL